MAEVLILNFVFSLFSISHSMSWEGLVQMGLFPSYGDGLHDEEQKLYVHATHTTSSLKVTASLKLNTDVVGILGN